MPEVRNLTVEEAQKVISVAGLNYELQGGGTYVGSQTPASFSQVAVGTTILLDTVEAALRQIEERRYETLLIARGIPGERIRRYGFGFRGKEVLIGEGNP